MVRNCIIATTALIGILITLDLSGIITAKEYTQQDTTKKTTITESEGRLEVYFCPEDMCEEIVLGVIRNSKSSVYCAFYDLDLESLRQLLKEKSRNIDVKLLLDERNSDSDTSMDFAKKQKRPGLMHNKFCIIDRKLTLTGSMNPTIRGTQKNDNNIIIISSEEIARVYDAEFDELWSNKKDDGKGSSVFMMNGTLIEILFCPEDGCTEAVVDALSKARKAIYFMTFSFTERRIANQLILKQSSGVDVRGVLENSQVSTYSVFSLLTYQGMQVRKDKNKYNMHHKVFIIDNMTVITGSYNPSKNADTRNDENMLIIENPELAVSFAKEFNRIFS